MKKRATAKDRQVRLTAKARRAAKAAKISASARQRREAEENRPRYSIDNPPTSFTMTVSHLAELRNRGLNQTYREVREGKWPILPRDGDTGPFAILTIPALQILRGERSPGPARQEEVAPPPAPPTVRPTPLRRRGEERAPT